MHGPAIRNARTLQPAASLGAGGRAEIICFAAEIGENGDKRRDKRSLLVVIEIQA